jgi:FkbM family methyltransferase
LTRRAKRPGMNALDVGANIGYFTLHMAHAVGESGRVLAVEADAESFPLLRANVALHDLGNVELLPVAADRQAGLLTLTRNPRNHGASTAVRAKTGWRSSPVQAVALDDVLTPDVPLDLIKIDVEGMDHAVVEGLRRTIARWRPVILVELNPGWLEVLGARPDDVLCAYRELGYEVRLLGGDALRMQQAGMALDDLLLDNLIIRPACEAALIAHTRAIHFVNLVLTPITDRTIRKGRVQQAPG